MKAKYGGLNGESNRTVRRGCAGAYYKQYVDYAPAQDNGGSDVDIKYRERDF